jgi:HEAT repeat protein
VGVAETFSCLELLSRPEADRLLDRALGEPHEAIQRGAVDRILADRSDERLQILATHLKDLMPPVLERLRGRRAELIVAAEEIIRRPDPHPRPAAFDLVAAVGDLSHAPLILQGLEDHSARVRNTTEAALARWMEEFYTRLLQGKKNRERVSEGIVQLFRSQALQVVQTLLGLYDAYPNPLWVRVGIELGEPAYLLFLERVLERPGSALHKAFLTSMCMSHSAEAMELIVRMTGERSPRPRAAAEEICKRRRDPAFGHELAAYLGSLEAETLSALAGRMLTAPWWEPALAAPDLSPEELALLARTLRATRLEAAQKREKIRALLTHPAGAVRAVAIEELDALGEAEIETLARRGLGDPDPAVALAAARVLMARAVPGLAALLAPLVKSEHLELSRLAMRAVAEESFKRYMAAFDQLDEQTRQKAAQAISKIDAGLIDRLRSEIESLDGTRRYKALRIVEYAHKEDELRPILMDLLYDADVKVRSTAIKTVQLAGSAEGMRILIDALNDPDRRVRANAVEALEAVADTRFTALLKPFLRDPDNRVRGNTAKALYRLGVLEAGQALAEMIQSPERLMRLTAAWVMHELGAPEFRPLLAERARVETDPHVLKRIQEALSGAPPAASAEGG